MLAGSVFFEAIFMEGKDCDTLHYMKGIQNVSERWEKLTQKGSYKDLMFRSQVLLDSETPEKLNQGCYSVTNSKSERPGGW